MTGLDLGRLTLTGGTAVERTVAHLVTRAARVVIRLTPHAALKSLVLAGGYGRGEGGVRLDEEGERPANN
nr:hypothetical protein [Vicinamibacteria bacterium]